MKRVAWLVAVLMTVTLSPAAPVLARPRHESGTFNTPAPFGSTSEKFAIVRHVERAIDHTPARTDGRQSRIFISTYLLDRKTSVDALVRACRRGVSVRVILDEDIASRPSKRLIRTLNSDNVRDRNGNGKPDRPPRSGPCNTRRHHGHGHGHGKAHDKGDGRGARGLGAERTGSDDRGGKVRHLTDREAYESVTRRMRTPLTWGKDRSYVKKCQGSCRGRGGNMHSKFYLFSRVHKVHHVVMVSSSNLNRGGATLGWNDLWTMKRRPRSYRAYAHIHREMTNDRRAGRGLVDVKDGPYVTRFFPMKHARKRNDPTLHDLSKIRCRGPLGRTKVRVSMFYWKGRRGNYLAGELLDRARAGCRVSIVYGAPSLQMAARLREAARRHLINVYDSRWDRNDDGFSETRTHAKYVLVKGHFGDHRRAWRVFTGSQNWVAGSLSRGDETTLNIRSRKAYREYIGDWNRIRRHSRRVPYHW